MPCAQFPSEKSDSHRVARQDGLIFYGSVAAVRQTLFSLKPLKKLIRKYTPESERVKIGFRQLREIPESMEARQSGGPDSLRNHDLVLMLREGIAATT